MPVCGSCMDKRKWLAVYTKPRWEKKIDQLLKEDGIESYCPLNKVHRKWSDRMKLVEEPLFKSYVFVRVDDEEEKKVRWVNGVLNFVYWLGKPAVIKPRDIERIKRFLRDYKDVEALAMNLPPNTQVIITSGVLMDKEARVIKANKKRVEVEIDSMGYKLVAYVDRASVTPVNTLLKKN
jgi:transcription antitermination factor NusG